MIATTIATTLDTESVGWIPYAYPSPSSQVHPDYIPPAKWGRDHFSTLLYLESRAVDHGGLIDNSKMRCDARLHRPFANVHLGILMDGGDHPTRLAGGTIAEGRHDDWSCAEDLAAFGYLLLWWTEPVEKESMFGYAKGKVELTDEGWALAAAIRRYQGKGGKASQYHIGAAI